MRQHQAFGEAGSSRVVISLFKQLAYIYLGLYPIGVGNFKPVRGHTSLRGFDVRVADGQHSTFIGTFNDVGAPKSVVDYHDHMVRTIVWYQTANNLEQVARPWKMVDDQQETPKSWCLESTCIHPILEAWK